eukprot:TRINITY_DN1030_c0_g1_i2.p1 TRINITY_DN1030_c0_g1~~TRINITY_DN1030_c0_g1_i2.p1  ORF type:complete len:163 (-),score=26.84 TRINITY_DN1030_c0_g1_i2:1020-1508(-)
MRAIIQRVTKASVSVDGKLISSIGKGLVVLVGITDGDDEKDAEYITRKTLNLRLWDGLENGKPWSSSVKQNDFELLIVSQFTLHAVLKGNRPDFHKSLHRDQSEPFFNRIVDRFRKDYKAEKIQSGEFGADMQVDLINDGPVTLTLETAQLAHHTHGKPIAN